MHGKSDDFILKDLKWTNIQQKYNNSVSKFTYKIMNHDIGNEHYLYNQLIENRNIKNTSENKLGPKTRVEREDTKKLKSFVHNIVNIYNSIPKYITQLRNYSLFKKWIKIYENDKYHKTQPKNSSDNKRLNVQNIDTSC